MKHFQKMKKHPKHFTSLFKIPTVSETDEAQDSTTSKSEIPKPQTNRTHSSNILEPTVSKPTITQTKCMKKTKTLKQ